MTLPVICGSLKLRSAVGHNSCHTAADGTRIIMSNDLWLIHRPARDNIKENLDDKRTLSIWSQKRTTWQTDVEVVYPAQSSGAFQLKREVKERVDLPTTPCISVSCVNIIIEQAMREAATIGPPTTRWPLTFSPPKWYPSHMWRGLPLCQF